MKKIAFSLILFFFTTSMATGEKKEKLNLGEKRIITYREYFKTFDIISGWDGCFSAPDATIKIVGVDEKSKGYHASYTPPQKYDKRNTSCKKGDIILIAEKDFKALPKRR